MIFDWSLPRTFFLHSCSLSGELTRSSSWVQRRQLQLREFITQNGYTSQWGASCPLTMMARKESSCLSHLTSYILPSHVITSSLVQHTLTQDTPQNPFYVLINYTHHLRQLSPTKI